MEHVTIPKQQKEIISNDNEVKPNYWRKDEIKQFLSITKQELPFRDHVLFHLLIYTGARKGEVLALKWGDIDLETGSVRFNKTLFHKCGQKSFLAIKKTPNQNG